MASLKSLHNSTGLESVGNERREGGRTERGRILILRRTIADGRSVHAARRTVRPRSFVRSLAHLNVGLRSASRLSVLSVHHPLCTYVNPG